MEIVDCPRCGNSRALGHRCPSCGDAATEADRQAVARSDPWQQAPAEPAAQPTQAAQPLEAASRMQATPPAAATPLAARPRRRMRWGLLVTLVVLLAVIAVIVVFSLRQGDAPSTTDAINGIPAMLQSEIAELTGGDKESTRQAASDQISDQMARALLENAMQTMSDVVVELDLAGEYPSTQYKTLIREALSSQTNRPFSWVAGTPGVYAQPHGSAQAEDSTVSWAWIPPNTFELGTWSTSGVAIGVRVDRDHGDVTFYRDGLEGY